MSDDVAPPPPPPPPPLPGRKAGGAPAPSSGGFKDSTAAKSGGFQWNWKAALNILVGIGLIAFGFFEYADIGNREAHHETVRFTGRRSGWLSIMYAIGGRTGVLGFFILAGVLFIGGAVLVMLGKVGHAKSDH
jgi:hypothetical protein